MNSESPQAPGRARHGIALVGWLVLCFLAPSIGGFFGPDEWYAGLNKPTWNPPGWIFGPVWTLLYSLMAVAAWLVWRRGGWTKQKIPLFVFLVQLVLNTLWTPLFFGLQQPGVAFAEIVLLWFAIASTLAVFRPVSRTAAILLVPYLVWVGFATVLNFTLWQMNP